MATENERKLKELLKAAEEEIVALHADSEEYGRMMGEMVDAQSAQDLQLAEMAEQIEKLQHIIHRSDEQMSEAAILMNALVGGMDSLRAQVKDALHAAQNNASQLELRLRVKAIANTADMSEEDKMVAEYNRQIAELREKLQSG